MKKGKPRGKTPSLIGSTLGSPRECVVERQCHCKRCDEAILNGTHCHEIAQLGGAFSSYKRYCDACFGSILQQTKLDLEALINEACPVTGVKNTKDSPSCV